MLNCINESYKQNNKDKATNELGSVLYEDDGRFVSIKTIIICSTHSFSNTTVTFVE